MRQTDVVPSGNQRRSSPKTFAIPGGGSTSARSAEGASCETLDAGREFAVSAAALELCGSADTFAPAQALAPGTCGLTLRPPGRRRSA